MKLEKRLASIEEEIKSAETVADVDRAKREYKKISSQIDKANEKKAVIDNMKTTKKIERKSASLGQQTAAAIKSADVERGKRFSVSSADVKANLRPSDYMPAITEYDQEIYPGARRELSVVDLFGQETTEAAAVTYFMEGVVDGEITTVAEGSAYPVLEFGDPIAQTDALKKIGCVYKDTDELLDDAQRLAQSIDNRAEYLMDVTEEDQVIAGDGEGSNILGLLNRDGVQKAEASDMVAAVDQIKAAKMGIRVNTPAFRADALVVNDEDWNEITSLKDNNGRYLAGGPFYGPIVEDGYITEPPMWGLRVVPTQAVPKGTMIVGCFNMGASVIRKGARVVDVTNSDSNDFENGIVAFRPSERMALAVRYPAAFVVITVSE